MNWLTNFVRPKLRALVARKEAPENLWLKCPKCEQMLFMRDWEANQEVCSHCNHHMRVRPKKRLPFLFDEGRFELHALPKVAADPLKFRDTKRYDARLKEAQTKSDGNVDALVVAEDEVDPRTSFPERVPSATRFITPRAIASSRSSRTRAICYACGTRRAAG